VSLFSTNTAISETNLVTEVSDQVSLVVMKYKKNFASSKNAPAEQPDERKVSGTQKNSRRQERVAEIDKS